MICREDRLVITFFTTTDAMAMEQFCREDGADGRIIPVPGHITAGCGLAWCALPESEAALRALMTAHGLQPQGVYRCMI